MKFMRARLHGVSNSAYRSIVGFLDGWECPSCGVSSQWKLTTAPRRRQQSVVATAACKPCGLEVFVKRYWNRGNPHGIDGIQPMADYETLCKVRQEFKQDEGLGTLDPLCVDRARGIVATRRVKGEPVSQWIGRPSRQEERDNRDECMYRSAQWLRRFHDTWDLGCTSLDMDEKLTTIEQRWSDSHMDSAAVRNGLKALRKTRSRIGNTRLCRSWIHGDFTPDNVIVDGETVTGIDIGMQSRNVVLYDIAPFLNHIRLMGPVSPSERAERVYEEMENAFLRGYGITSEIEEMALWWVRLYFMLSYWRTFEDQYGLRRLNVMERHRFTTQVKTITRKVWQA